jgi:hypothetical protein
MVLTKTARGWQLQTPGGNLLAFSKNVMLRRNISSFGATPWMPTASSAASCYKNPGCCRTLLRLNVREDQSIDLALQAKGNQGFVRDFMQTLPDNERATLMRADLDMSADLAASLDIG